MHTFNQPYKWATALLVALLCLAPVTSYGQGSIRIPEEALIDETAVREVLANGEQLERQGRWGEALSFYEDALRLQGFDVSVQRKANLARLHYDVGRRYSDQSFVRSVDAMSRDEALRLYDEVLRKVQASYVDSPRWSEVAREGMKQLDVALKEEVFANKNLKNVQRDQIERVRRMLNENVNWQEVSSPQQAVEMANYAAELMWQNLGVTPTATVLEFACGTAASLDPYTSFLTQDQLAEVYSQIEGNFVGLGVELKTEANALLIVNSIDGSPAHQAGIRSGDRIVAVDGQRCEVISPDKAADLLKGPIGSTVRVSIVAADQSTRDIVVRRDRVEVPSVDNIHILDPESKVGYLKITNFQKNTPADLSQALWKLHREGMRALVIDLRGNPGGLLTASVDMVDLFVEEGTIVSTRGRNAREDFDYTAHMPGTWRVPLVVLIDSNSASASEIFAGAIRDHRRGTVVGQRSYGKGSVQGIFPLATAGTGLRLTTAKFYSPSGRAISRNGVLPDVKVRVAAKPAFGQNGLADNAQPQGDPVMDAGLTAAKELIGITGLSTRLQQDQR
ncbi:S41 family peptidase [Blastopirellula marina]|uniref:Peptidase S41 n=1 Tax=Blastopirellula marina TaxID=124 RepID=A0A2S8GJC5_9BACT|nr:S41 family peptidase [Blastopirellula marina]PQO44555.1 peptidase S41 [Blastopirellula marina]